MEDSDKNVKGTAAGEKRVWSISYQDQTDIKPVELFRLISFLDKHLS
jgi:hypothetical protein